MSVHWYKWPDEKPSSSGLFLVLFSDTWLQESCQRQIGMGQFAYGDWLVWGRRTPMTFVTRETEKNPSITILAWDVIQEDGSA